MFEVDKRLAYAFAALLFVFITLALPFFGIVALFMTSGAATVYYGAITGGLYKDSLLETFRQYGEESRSYPLVNLLVMGAAWCFTSGMLLSAITTSSSFFARLLPGTIFTLLALALFGAAIFIYQQPDLRTALPSWYARLLREGSRQERRHIAWAWLRLPRLMRLRLSGDQKAFEVWAELVRLTVIYGAYDPKSPWHRWT